MNKSQNKYNDEIVFMARHGNYSDQTIENLDIKLANLTRP